MGWLCCLQAHSGKGVKQINLADSLTKSNFGVYVVTAVVVRPCQSR
jgi:hypothetical protein